MEKLYNRKEAASFLGISITSLDRARYAGKISYIQYAEGGNVFFTEAGLQEYMAKATHRPAVRTVSTTYRTIRSSRNG